MMIDVDVWDLRFDRWQDMMDVRRTWFIGHLWLFPTDYGYLW